MNGVYFDTSALAKWYLNEARSDEVAEYLAAVGPVTVSGLALVEMRSLVARRRRDGSIDAATEGRVLATLEEDVSQGFVRAVPLTEQHAEGAYRLFGLLPDIPLRSLDALHLATARSVDADTIVTADRIMVTAAEALGLQVVRFD